MSDTTLPSPAENTTFQRDDVRNLFLIAFAFCFTFAQGIRAGIPIPSFLPLCIIYVGIYRPSVSLATVRVYGVMLVYMIAVSIRNALEPSGDVKDFLYAGICGAAFLLTVCLQDLVENVELRTLGKVLLWCTAGEVAVQILEFLGAPGFTSDSFLVQYWGSITRSVAFMNPLEMALRVQGSFGSPTTVAFVGYLMLKGAAIALRRNWIGYLGIVPIFLGQARMALLIFLFWELVVVPITTFRKSKRALMVTWLIAGGAVALVALIGIRPGAAPFVISTLIDTKSPTGIAESVSVVNRLLSFRWALEHWTDIATTGGLTVQEFNARESTVFGVDSELILRGMQFGLAGYICFAVMNLWVGSNIRDRNWWFVLLVSIPTSVVANSLYSNPVVFPIVILYCFCVRQAREESHAYRHNSVAT